MQYERYEARVAKIANVMKFIFRHMKKIIFAFSCVLVITGALLGTKGIIVSAESCPQEITYGESLGYSANAFLSKVKYEYRKDGSDTWSEKTPTEPGKYFVRAAAKALFGYRYSDEEAFELKPKTITVSISNKSVMYGENPSLTAQTAYSDKIVCEQFIYSDNKTVVKAEASAIRIINAEGEDVTSSYNFSDAEGEIKITKRPIKVSLSDKSKVYDGTALIGSEYAIDSGSLANGDTLRVEFNSGIVEAGSIKNTGTLSIVNSDGNDVTEYYALTTVFGTLTVQKRELSLKTESAEFMYDGSNHQNEKYSIVNGTALAEGDAINIKLFSSIFGAGSIDNTCSFYITNENGDDVTSSYSVSTEWGKLTVTPRPITIASNSESKIYDGEVLLNNSIEIKGEYGLAPGDILETFDWTTLIDVGSCENRPGTIFITSMAGGGPDIDVIYPIEPRNVDDVLPDIAPPDITEPVIPSGTQAKNYQITYEWGTLEITKRTISLTTKDLNVVYDGEYHSASELETEKLAAGDFYNFTKVTSALNVGTYENELEFDIFNSERNKSVIGNYEISITFGTISISKRPIMVTAPDGEWTYDGTEHYNDSVEIGESGLAAAHTVKVLEKTTVKNFTEGTDNIVKIAVFSGEEDVSANYEISYTNGTLKVNKREITVYTADDSKIYDDTLLENDSVTIDNIVDIHTFEVISSSGIIYAGSISNSVTDFDILDENGESVKDNYSVHFEEGTLTVDPRPIIVQTKSDSKVYDATALTAPEWLIYKATEFDYDLISGHVISAPTPNGSRTVVGISDNGYIGSVEDIKIMSGNTDMTANYAITEVIIGTLTVEPRPITVGTNDISATYDAKLHSDNILNLLSGELCDGHSFEVTYCPEFCDAIENAENKVEFYITDGIEDVTSNYDITYKYGKVNIAKRAIKTSTNDISLIYDGEPHSDSGINIVSGELCDGHSFEITYCPEFRDAIENGENKVEFYITDGSGDVTKNYDLSIEYGKVNITRKALKVTTNGITKTYDGYVFFDKTINIVSGELCDGDSFEVTYCPEFCDAVENGENKVEFYITDGSRDVTKNYDLIIEYGKVNIAKRKITVSTNAITLTYDGKAHSDATVNITSGELCESQTLSKIKAPEFKNAVTDAENKVSFDITNGTVSTKHNYDIKYEYGKVNIAKRAIKFHTASYSGVYDGKDHTDYNPIIDSGELCENHKFVITKHVTIKNATNGTVKNEITYKIVDKSNEQEDLQSNYAITYTAGDINVSKRAIKFHTASYSGVYDGKDHTDYNPMIDSGELCENHKFVITKHVTIKNATNGTVKNEITYKIVDKANEQEDLQSNYAITYTAGDINVSKREINVETPSYSGVYDGFDHSGSLPFTVIKDGSYHLCDGHTFNILSSTPMKNAVSNLDNVITFEIWDENEQNVDSNYEIVSTKYGKINISKFELKIKTHSQSFKYDGQAHSYESYEIVNSEEFYFTVYYGDIQVIGASSITNVWDGPIANELQLCIYDSDWIDVTEENYIITVTEYGQLTVTPRNVIITSKDAEKYYDGKALTFPRWELAADSEDTILAGHELKLDFTGSQTVVGESANTYENVRVFCGEDDVTENYNITSRTGTLTVKERSGGTNLGLPVGGEGDGGGDGDGKPVFIITSEKDGKVYLKIESYGSYNGKGFDLANEYDTIFGEYSASHILPLILSGLGEEGHTVKIDPVGGIFALPYYTNSLLQKSDVYAVGDISSAYTLLCYLGAYYDTVSNNAIPGLADFEMAYREFVYANYLDIDYETYAYMSEIIAENGFYREDSEIIKAVADYIKSAATYNLDYNPALNESDNIVISFLSDFREGVCQHYAAAATMLFRALGIPARYTVGYMAEAMANVPVEVSPLDGHAWVEVYLDGIGWVRVEVTGSVNSDADFEGTPGGDNPGGDTPGDDNPGDSGEENKITIRPNYLYKEYDGQPLYAENSIDESDPVLQELLSMGYWYEVTVEGEQLDIGRGISTITSFVLYDPTGTDVTEDYVITKENGALEVRGATIKIYLYEKSFEYDGLYHSYQSDEWFEVTDFGSMGVELVINSINIGLINTGELSSRYINIDIPKYISYSVYINGDRTVNYADYYRIIVVDWRDEGEYNPITITPREITIETDSATKSYDRTPLTKNSFYISSGLLAEGHRIELEVTGSQTAIGKSYNTVKKDSFAIYDASGVNVTKNYNATIKASGVLEVV